MQANSSKTKATKRGGNDKGRSGLLNPKFEYTHSSQTDITKTWRKHGWKPLTK